MSVLLTRRKVISGMGLLGIGILAGCDTRGELSPTGSEMITISSDTRLGTAFTETKAGRIAGG
ncbi:hypothetical protein M2399_003654 [Pseudomonas sp. BIGb0450]|jgi:hypothetical protein|nr:MULTISPECIES: hypothetical protein [Pseudomonas]MCS3419428.1 hypothetical protein [Pseudomonas sp. BIGb0558]MCS3438200.1 hypothetical protein [Pseudomonas sp. BIGb0450]